MKQALLVVAAMVPMFTASAQLTSVSIETVLEHDGSVEGVPAGYTTYRIYANLTNEYDFVSAVSGDSQDPMFLNNSDILQVAAGGDFASNVTINPVLVDAFPALPYDSWFTIGAEDASEGWALQTTFGSSSELIQNFQAGQGFLVDGPVGGSWFNTYPCVGQDLASCAEGVVGFAGGDLKVLLGQITATGEVTGMFNLQVFVNGDQAEQQNATGYTFSTNPADVFGCMDPNAQNYDAEATEDDLTCIFPCSLELNETAVTVTSPTCAGDNSGTIQAEANGAQGADYYYLDTIAGVAANFGNFGQLLAGTYDVIVVDAAQCRDTLSVTVPAVDPVTMTAELTTDVSCHNAADGVITITEVSGGDGNYSFGISTNPTELSTDLVWEGIGNTNGNNQTYSFTVFDGNGCVGTSEGILVPNPQEVFVALASTNPVVDASCANIQDGEIYLIALGGSTNSVGPFEFSVDGENYGPSPVTVTGGTYTIMARDPVGCTATLEYEVVVGPPAIEVNAAVETEPCVGDGGEVSWAPTGGEGNYTFTFNGEATTETMAGDLAPGTYTVVVTDGEGCTGEKTVEVEAAVPISVATEVIDASCFGENDGVVTVNAEGGSGFYQYSEDGVNFIPNNQFGGFGAGTHPLFVQDEFGCVETGSATVGNGICDDQEIYGCRYELAENYNPEATLDDDSCIFPCEGAVNINVFDWDEDYAVTVTDFLMMLSVYGDVDVDFDGVWDSGDLCVDTDACNYDVEPSEECAYIDVLGICGGGCEADADNDGICDDVDTCVGIEDECGVCNGPGPTEVVIESITILYDSVYLPQLAEWYVYEFGADTTFIFTCAPSCGDLVSYQGYDYATVLIGEQCWFAENLRSEKYENGDAIPAGLSDTQWENTTSGAVAVYGEGSSQCPNYSPDGDACDEVWSLSEYGRLYNWYAVDDTRGLCPSGWHVPMDEEWMVMEVSLGMSDALANVEGYRGTDQGTQMKTDYGWFNGGHGTNSTDFSGVPGGLRYSNGVFNGAGSGTYWWSASQQESYSAWLRGLNWQSEMVLRSHFDMKHGYSVRCVRDAE